MSEPTGPLKPKTPPSTKRATGAEPAQKAVARKAGHVIDTPGDHGEEHVPEPEIKSPTFEVRQEEQLRKANEAINRVKQTRRVEREDSQSGEKKKRRQQERREEQQRHPQQNLPEPKGEGTKAGILAHNAAFAKSNADGARERGFQNTPGLGEIMAGKSAPRTGDSLAEVMPAARIRPHPDLPEPDMRPPVFLSLLESMSDIYMRTRGRMTNKTKELLESTALEDLIGMIAKLHENDELLRNAEARLHPKIYAQLKDEPGPLLLGLNDGRLTEPWRLFIDRWEIWVPDDKDEAGVELFWEGEGEDDDGEAIEILQSLTYQRGELTLYAKMGPHEDRITFDGEVFYRLKTELKPKKTPSP